MTQFVLESGRKQYRDGSVFGTGSQLSSCVVEGLTLDVDTMFAESDPQFPGE